jgi:nucleotidyltransferase/DNA polymerase involved in DNA repair
MTMPTRKTVILHVDMDAFYASIEQRDNPALKGKPVIVGSAPDQRGVVSTASYEARVFGVHSAMPSRSAYQRCPHGVFLPVRMDVYRDVSREVMTCFQEITPLVQAISIDEAFLDVSGAGHIHGSPLEIARLLQSRIRDTVNLSCSVGIAPNKFLAKLASELDKPGGITSVPDEPEEILAFLAPMPITRVWGVGQRTEERLKAYGLTTIAHLQALTLEQLVSICGENLGQHLYRLARGIDDRVVEESGTEKSISAEHTFTRDCMDDGVLHQTLLELAEKVGRRLRRSGMLARTVTIKLRESDFATRTRQQALDPPACNDRDLLHAAFSLFEAEYKNAPLRLIGFGVSNFQSPEEFAAGYTPMLFTDMDPLTKHQRDRGLDTAVDRLREQYGADIIRRGDWRKKSDEG